MRSKASVKGHPIHPALIPFPLAFLIGALIFDLLGVLLDRPTLWTTGGQLAVAGIIAALIAAVPGFVDYLYTVPPNSTGKARATRHMAVNLSAVVLFALALWLRGGTSSEPGLIPLALEAAGSGLLTAGGWMGGVLVSRNQISVDHRYAGAGKWQESKVDGTTAPIAIGRTDELQINQLKLVHVGDQRIVLGRTENGWVAFADRCTHRGGSLADGALICGTVQCPWHGSQFDTHDGAVKAGPAKESIAVYPVEERNGVVYLLRS